MNGCSIPMITKGRTRNLLANIVCLFPVERLYDFFEKIRLKRLRQNLKYCGKGVVLRKGFLVMAPEKLYLANDVSFAVNVSIMGGGGCTIGLGSMIATGVTILTTQHDPAAPIMRKTGIHKPVTIGKEVWIGTGAIILPGVSIGDNSIVAAGAVVTHDVKPYQVVGGVPAKFLWDRRSPK